MSDTKRNVSLFAGPGHPIRVSSVPSLMRCSSRAALMFLEIASGDSGGVAAHNGSSFHCLVEEWHKNGFRDVEARDVEQTRRHEWPDAKDSVVYPAFIGYCRDPRNRIELFASELAINFTLNPSQDDPTGELIHFTGHVDQVRFGATRAEPPAVWDMKLSRLGGGDLINSYAYQIAMYAIGTAKYLGRDVVPGGIIRCSTYSTKEAAKVESPDGVFFPVNLTPGVLDHMVRDITATVAAIRRGQVSSRPGDWCSYCPIGHVSRCVPLVERAVTCRPA